MTSEGLVLAIATGAGVIAFWIDARWGGLAPQRPGLRLVHVVIAIFVAQYVAPAVMSAILPSGRSVALEMTALFAIFLPALVYVFLSGIWLLRLLHRALQPY